MKHTNMRTSSTALLLSAIAICNNMQVYAQQPPQPSAAASSQPPATSQPPGVEKSIIEVGFNLDGSTTYCRGIPTTETDPMQFFNLTASSAGRCPLTVDLAPTFPRVKVSEPVDVVWKVRKNPEVNENIFPGALEPSGRPKDVVAAFVKACKVGTNCKPAFDPQAIDSTLTLAGHFNEQNEKHFPPFRFAFAESGKYIITAKVNLPGDPALHISGMQFLTFQTVLVTDARGNVANTVSLAPSFSPAPASSRVQLVKSSPSTASPSSNTEGAENISTESAEKNKMPLNSIIIMGVCAVCFFAFIIVSVMLRRNKRQQGDNASETRSNTFPDEQSRAFPSMDAKFMEQNSIRNHRSNSRTRSGSKPSKPSKPSNTSSDGKKLTVSGYDADGLLKADVISRIDGDSIVNSAYDSDNSPTSSIHSKAASKWSDTMSYFDDTTNNSELWDDDDSRGVSYATSPPGTKSRTDRTTTESSLESFDFRPSDASNTDSYASRMTSFSSATYGDHISDVRSSRGFSWASSRSSVSSASSYRPNDRQRFDV